MEVAVVGAGILGASVTYELSKLGVSVDLYDADRPGGGTSGATFSWLNSYSDDQIHYHELRRESISRYGELLKELGASSLLHLDGSMHFSTFDELREMQEAAYDRHVEWDYPVERISADQAQVLEPELDLTGVDVVYRYPEEGWVEAVPFVGSLIAAAKERGARVRYPARVVGLQLVNGRQQLRLESGESAVYDSVVVASGARSEEVAALAGVSLAVETVPGVLVQSRQIASSLRHVVWAPGAHFRPDGGARVMVGDGDFSSFGRFTQPEEVRARGSKAFEAAGRWLPALRSAPLDAIRVGVRPIPQDGLPLVGWSDPSGTLYALVSHGGITLAPRLAQLCAREIASGNAEPKLEQYRPFRFGKGD